jgi:hypothetical protein
MTFEEFINTIHGPQFRGNSFPTGRQPTSRAIRERQLPGMHFSKLSYRFWPVIAGGGSIAGIDPIRSLPSSKTGHSKSAKLTLLAGPAIPSY